MADGIKGLAKTYSICIGIDNYKTFPLPNCVKDASRIHEIIKLQAPDTANRHYLLLNGKASKDSILAMLKSIAVQAKPDDQFVFFYAGFTLLNGAIENKSETLFCPAGSIDQTPKEMLYGDSTLNQETIDGLISMKLLQEYVQLIPCTQQMFIAEAASTENLNAEFAAAFMQGSPDLAALQAINRVIIAPKKIGQELADGGMLALSIQKLDPSKYKLLDLFNASKANGVARAIMENCKGDYATVFFEKEFIKLYQQINKTTPVTRSRNVKLNLPDPMTQAYANKKKYALVIGTNNYKAKGWDLLNNPIHDAEEIATVLSQTYGYDTIILKNPSADNIYKSILKLHETLDEDDDFILYVAGHGDYDKMVLDDGFIVCNDSKSVEDDPMRNTYIAHSKLKRILNKLPAKNVLVLLDVCHAGTFDDGILGVSTRDGSTSQLIIMQNRNRFLVEKSKYATRKVLTSVGTQPAFDGEVGAHSPFATYLLKLLYAAGGEVGMLTASDLFSSLQKAGMNEETDMRIYPHQAGFGSHEPEGEFILLPLLSTKNIAEQPVKKDMNNVKK
jgi:hypothetical protein